MLSTAAHLEEFFLHLLGDITGGSEAWTNNLQLCVCQQTAQTNNSSMQRTERRQETLISSVCLCSQLCTHTFLKPTDRPAVREIKSEVCQVQWTGWKRWMHPKARKKYCHSVFLQRIHFICIISFVKWRSIWAGCVISRWRRWWMERHLQTLFNTFIFGCSVSCQDSATKAVPAETV